jgi:predicted deacetylase
MVSVHDVAPSTLRETRWLLAALDAISARSRTLMVIPAEPEGPLGEDRELCAVLSAEAAAGTEVVLNVG